MRYKDVNEALGLTKPKVAAEEPKVEDEEEEKGDQEE